VNEAVLSDLVRAAERWLARPKIVGAIFRALRTRTTPRRAADLALGVERLAARAFEQKLTTSLSVVVRSMQDEPAWCSRVSPAWFAIALENAITRKAVPLIESLLYGWVRSGRDAEPGPELRECVERNPQIFTSTMTLAPFLCWRLQQVVPTTAGWRALAADRSRAGDVPSAELFGSELDLAIETLEVALGEEAEGARRVILAGWFAALGGTP
jgi:hypothetical protein